MAAMAPNPARLAAMALTHARSRRPRPAGPGSPSPASRPQRGRPWRGHGVPRAAPASAAARLGLAGPGALAPTLPRRPARPARPSRPCPFLTRGPGSTSTAVAHGSASPAMALAPALPGAALPLSPCAARSRPLAPASSPARPRRPGASPASRSHPRGPAWWRGAASCAAPAPRPPQRALSRLSQHALPLPGAALSSARRAYGARPRAVGLGVAPLPLATRNAARVRLGPGVCAARPRCVTAALRIRARVERAVLWHGSPCPRRVRLPLVVPVYPPPCIPCVVIALFLSINENSI
jgi:hypothetical protein